MQATVMSGKKSKRKAKRQGEQESDALEPKAKVPEPGLSKKKKAKPPDKEWEGYEECLSVKMKEHQCDPFVRMFSPGELIVGHALTRVRDLNDLRCKEYEAHFSLASDGHTRVQEAQSSLVRSLLRKKERSTREPTSMETTAGVHWNPRASFNRTSK